MKDPWCILPNCFLFKMENFPLPRWRVSACLPGDLAPGWDGWSGPLHPAVVLHSRPTLLQGVLCDRVVSCVFSTRKGVVTKANSDTWYSYVHTRAREKLHLRDCWQLLEVVPVQKLHSFPLATRVNGFVVMLEPYLNENSEHLHWKNIK